MIRSEASWFGVTEDKAAMAAALALTKAGVEPADAMHLTGRPAGAEFVSFDCSLIRRATVAEVKGVAAL